MLYLKTHTLLYFRGADKLLLGSKEIAQKEWRYNPKTRSNK